MDKIIITNKNDNNSNSNDNNFQSILNLQQNKATNVQVEGIDYPYSFKYEFLSPYRRYGRVSDDLLRTLYLRTAKIRECVDGIAREIASRDMFLFPIFEDAPAEFWKALKLFSISFFGRVNRKHDTMRMIVEKIVRDLLVHGRAFVEKVKDRTGKVVELYVRDPASFIVQRDEHGIVLKFIQNVSGKKVEFEPDDIIYFTFNACSYDDYGLPIIEGILDEVATLIISNRTIANHIFDDTIPPGILVLGEIGEEAYERLKSLFTNPAERNKLKVIRNISPNSVSWIRLDRSLSSDQKLDYLLERLDKIILKAFQIPLEESMTSRGGAELTEKLSQSKLIEPLVKLIEDKFTHDLFIMDFKLPVKFKILKNILGSQEFYDYARGLSALINAGVLTYNEARNILSLPQIYNGNVRVGKLGNEFVTFGDDGKPERLPEFLENS